MGFLNNSTNNIIVDAVLTKEGRAALARGNGSFKISKFAFSDEEVDYKLVESLGRTIGIEAIIKNTPVLEATLSSEISLRSKLVSLPNNSLIGLPTLASDSGSSFSLNLFSNKNKSFKVNQAAPSNDAINANVVNQVYSIQLDSKFLTISGRTPRTISDSDIATYLIRRDQALTAEGGSVVSLTISVNPNIRDSFFSIYSTASDSNKIVAFATITGMQDGQTLQIQFNISKT